MSETLRRIINIRSGGRVERCHTVPHHGSYNNAMHQWGVAMLMWELWPKDFPRLSIYCLGHDVPEKWTGDMPATAKKYISGVSGSMSVLDDSISVKLQLPPEGELKELDRQKLKNCDYLELYLWCVEQMQMGNNCVLEVILSLDEFFDESPLLPNANLVLMKVRAYMMKTFPNRLRELVNLGDMA